MSHAKNNGQVTIPGPNYRDIGEYCKKFGLNEEEERKLKRLLGKHAPLHELHANAPAKSPRYR